MDCRTPAVHRVRKSVKRHNPKGEAVHARQRVVRAPPPLRGDAVKALVAAVFSCLLAAHAFGQDIQFGTFRSAAAFAVSPTGETIVIDGPTSELLHFSAAGVLIRSIGGYGWSETEFDHPRDVIWANALDVYVADFGNHRIQRYDRALSYVSSLFLRENEDPQGRFGYPKGVGMSRLGALFIADGENVRIVKVGVSNSVERVFGGVDAGAGKLLNPSRVRVSTADLVYVRDDDRIVVFDIFGNYVGGAAAAVKGMRSFAVREDTLYVLDSCSVHVFDSGGKERSVIELGALLDGPECPPVDIAVQGDRLYILAQTRVVVHRLKF